MDEDAHIQVTGLPPGAQVTLTAHAVARQGVPWDAAAVFRANADGVVDPSRSAPVSGSYQGVDDMGIVWSMRPRTVRGANFWAPDDAESYSVALSAQLGGRTVATTVLTRIQAARGVTDRVLTLAADHVEGHLYLPPPGPKPRPGLVIFGGSEGGNLGTIDAELLASHGYPTIALGYFGMPGLPANLENIPLEYFATAGRLLAKQPGVDANHILVDGYSRGTEAAVLLADTYPDLFHGAILYAPNDRVDHALGYSNRNKFAWTLAGKPIPQGLLPVDHISGPVLAIAGDQDTVWYSTQQAQTLMRGLDADHDPYFHQALIYPMAGHGLGTFPFRPSPASEADGGTPSGNNTAREASWSRLLQLLASLD
ncbi:acyl-CoA thioesterase/bile acid-CoA:amino acid N-acyltransferase family protein [Streptacidiphilus anmyonensis]|uniref:acyl-CoA thioesterase/bile acid-CoA:amino acid N-acyltransferase family protein n=1 Tax=Streptacidiphilus anmyonensis TaxID=405782 RepID=UPI0009FF8205|nr:acyl-CoA thioesterase/bile acid-CoA:amino acid N-acyltransferase family protein [Streptacidiphilus anmyonensis]